jgi:hypothetical protein
MDLAQQRLAERRLLAAMRRLHRRDPLRADYRMDTVIAELRADPGERQPAGHRGGGSLAEASDDDLRRVLDELAGSGALVRKGRRVRLTEHSPGIADAEMRARVDRLIDGLREAGAEPPRVEAVAARLGIPPAVIDSLRSSGRLVHVADGIDYPQDVLERLMAAIAAAAARGQLSVPGIRDELRTSRRHAEALLEYRRSIHATSRDTRGVR